MTAPDRWDTEARELWGAFAREAVRRGTPPGAHMNLDIIAALARRAYREGLERAAEILQSPQAQQRGNEEPEWNGFLSALEWGSAAIRREIEGV